MPTLVICEKANAADKIAYFLSNGKSKTQRVGKIRVHNFQSHGEDFFAVGLRGHVVSFDYKKEFNDWKKAKLEDLVWAEPVRRVMARDILRALESVFPKNVIIATDYDREGELIGAEALDLINWSPAKAKRARFSALTGEEIRTAFDNLVDVDVNLADAGMARQYIDLAWGAVLTRFISLATGKMGKEFLSVGRVQTPTLALVVKREKEIQSFKPEPYWELKALLGEDSFTADHEKNPFWDEMEAIRAKEKAKEASEAIVAKCEVKERRRGHPFHSAPLCS